MITIENEHFSSAIAPLGAELRSFKEKSTAREFMWNGDPAIWSGSAPILFPIVGALRNGRTTINGKGYEMPKHGLVRTRKAKVVEHESDRAVFAFTSDTETLRHYPFPFLFEVEFRLEANELKVLYRVKNTGPDEMLFSIGSHPAFSLDLQNKLISDYHIEFSDPETLELYGLENGLLAKKQDNYLVDSTRIQLSETLFADDALVFKNIQSRTVRLKSKKELRHLEVDTHGAPHLGLWAKPGAPYVCIEPWYSFDDQPDCDGILANKPGMMSLPAGDTFKTGYTVRIVT